MTRKTKIYISWWAKLLPFLTAKPAQEKPRHTGKTVLAAMARYEREQANDHGANMPSAPQQPIVTPRASKKHPKHDWLASVRSLFASASRWTKPNRSGKKVLAALARQNDTPNVTAKFSQPASLSQESDKRVSVKEILSAFREQAVTFARNNRKLATSAAGSMCLVLILASTAFSPITTASSFDRPDSSASQQTINIAPLVVQDGGLDTPPQDMPDESADTGTVVQLSGTPKIPVLHPTLKKERVGTASTVAKLGTPHGGRVHVVFNEPTQAAKVSTKAPVTKQHKSFNLNKVTIAKYRAEAIGLFAEAKGIAGNLDNAENNRTALFKYMEASSAAQRGGIMATNKYVKNMHVEWAKMYMGVKGIPKNLKLAAQVALAAGKDNPASKRLLNEIFVTEPSVLINLGELTKTEKSPRHPAGNWSSRAVSLHSTL